MNEESFKSYWTDPRTNKKVKVEYTIYRIGLKDYIDSIKTEWPDVKKSWKRFCKAWSLDSFLTFYSNLEDMFNVAWNESSAGKEQIYVPSFAWKSLIAHEIGHVCGLDETEHFPVWKFDVFSNLTLPIYDRYGLREVLRTAKKI